MIITKRFYSGRPDVNNTYTKKVQTILIFFLLIPIICLSQTHPYQDLSHESKVFGKPRYFRLYLPDSYQQSTQRYPVVFFFHGYGGRYNKEPSVNPEYEMLGDLVNKYQVIMVMWDGNMEEQDPRPYNTGDHQHVRHQIQMKDYFPELVGYIDANYRTLADREHRGIIGFSMGGFMSMVIAGRYPDMVSAITNMVGSPEFYLGYPDNHTLYPHRYMFENLQDVSVRMHNMDQCPLSDLNIEIKNAAAWEGRTDFEYWIGHGPHKADEPGETKLFEAAMQFIVNRFNYPVALHKTWTHYDLYADFDLWGYSVKSNKKEPGFLVLRNVSPAGFGFYTRRWMPDGPVISNCTATVTTAPIYKKDETYDILVYEPLAEKPALRKEKAGQDGRLRIEVTGDGCEVSIAHPSQPADFIVLHHSLDKEKRFIRVNENNEISLTLLNRGGNNYADRKLLLTVKCADPSVLLNNAIQELTIDGNEYTCKSLPIGIACTKTPPGDASPPWLKLNVQVRCGDDEFTDAITVPVFYDVPYFTQIEVDDGNIVKDKAFGVGNSNGQAEASEQIMLYENGQRLRLYTDDPYVETVSEQLYSQTLQGVWADDGFRLSSIVKIAANCPVGHTIEFLANYEETVKPIRRVVHWGKVRIVF